MNEMRTNDIAKEYEMRQRSLVNAQDISPQVNRPKD